MNSPLAFHSQANLSAVPEIYVPALESVSLEESPSVSKSGHFETIQALLDVSEERFDELASQCEIAQQPATSQTYESSIDLKIKELVDQARAFEREKCEIEQLRDQLRIAIETAESRLAAAASDESRHRLAELEIQLVSANTENAKISNLLLNARSEYQSLVEFIEAESHTLKVCENQNITSVANQEELYLEVEQLKEQIEFLKAELADQNHLPDSTSGESAELRIQIEKLRSQLLEARREAVESRLQSSDLSSSLAKYKDPNDGQRNEALSWEQRKEALLRQLDSETNAEIATDSAKILEIQRVIEQTDMEILRREQEIAELRSLLQQQAIAQNGVAIGVAAFAEMVESDAIIIAERMRLQELQQEWESKQRQAEIEMSMERAKLARERLELQEKTRVLEAQHPNPASDESSASKERSRGRWLARLGLRDE